MVSPFGAFLQPEGFAAPSAFCGLVHESSAVLEAARLARRTALQRAQRGLPTASATGASGAPVVLVPGYLAGDLTLKAMASFLRGEGYRSYRSHIRVNTGCTLAATDRLESRVEAIAIRREAKVTIVGHSLGGMLARAVAARRPDLVSGIVTLGSPVLAPGAVHHLLGLSASSLSRLSVLGLGTVMSRDCLSGECAEESWTLTRAPLAGGVGYTAIFSKRDGIVDWRACREPGAEAVEVSSSHCGMAIDPAVMDQVARALRRQQRRTTSAAAPRAGRRSARLRPVASS